MFLLHPPAARRTSRKASPQRVWCVVSVSVLRATLIAAGRVPAPAVARALSLFDTVRHRPARVPIPTWSRGSPKPWIARGQPVPNSPAVTATNEQTPPRTKRQSRIASAELAAAGRGESESSTYSARHCRGPLCACFNCRTTFSRDRRNQRSRGGRHTCSIYVRCRKDQGREEQGFCIALYVSLQYHISLATHIRTDHMV